MQTAIRTAIFLFFCTVGLYAEGWAALPGTKLRDACPPNNFNGIQYRFHDNCQAVISAWSSAALDTRRNRLIVWGGGHNDYWGNEVYALNLDGVPSWSRLTDPSPVITDCAVRPNDVNPDGTPASMHTYSGMVYLPDADRLFVFGGSPAPCGNPISRRTWTLDLSVSPPVWHDMTPPVWNAETTYAAGVEVGIAGVAYVSLKDANVNHTPATSPTWWSVKGYDPSTDAGSPTTGAFCAYNPADSAVYCVQGDNFILQKYDFATNTWKKLKGYGTTPVGTAAHVVIDPIRQLMIFMGGQLLTPGKLKVHAISLSPGSTYAVQDWSTQVTGCDALAVPSTGYPYPGLAYDPARGVIVGWPSNGNTVYTFNPDLKTCTAHTFAGGPPVVTPPNAGTFGRFAYVPVLGQYVVVNSADYDAYTLTLDRNPVVGLGKSTLTCIDRDGDGYGTGPGCTGTDADDLDDSVATRDQVLEKYGSLQAVLNHLGYNPSRLCFISTTGNDSTAACGDEAKPYKNFTAIPSIGPGTAIIYREGTYTGTNQRATPLPPGGAPGKPLIIISYPGEMATFDMTATSYGGIDTWDTSYLVVDGFKVTRGLNGGCIRGGSSGYKKYSDGGPSTWNNSVYRRIDAYTCLWGITAAGMQNITVEDSVFRDNTVSGQHGIYMGSRSIYSDHVYLRRILAYNNGYSGIQLNGKMTNVVQEYTLTHSNGINGTSWLNGVNRSIYRNNLAWGNNSPAFTINNYNSLEGGSNSSGTSGTEPCTCSPANLGSSCPHDQVYNLIEGNVLYNGGTTPTGAPVPSVAVQVALQNRDAQSCAVSGCCTTPACLRSNLGHNTFKNNILVGTGLGGYYPSIAYRDADKDYLSTSTFINNLHFHADGSAAQTVIGFGGRPAPGFGVVPYTCEQAASITNISGCLFSDPKFTAASPAWWNSPSTYNFRPQPSSPAIGTGASGSTMYDFVGQIFSAPTRGAYAGAFSGNACDVNGDGVVNGRDVDDARARVFAKACGSLNLQRTGACNVVEVQRVAAAAMGMACVTGP